MRLLRLDHAAFVHHGVQHLGHGKQAHGDQHDVDAVQQLGLAAGVARLASDLVHADAGPAARPTNSAVMPRSVLLPSTALTVVKASTISMKYSGGPSFTANSATIGAQTGHDHRGNGARHERANGRCGQRRAGAAALGHLVALHGRDHAGGFARRVEQDGGGGAAIHGTVVDAGKEDHRGRDLDLGGDGQQHGHRHRRADAGQHAHGRAQRAAHEGPQQVGGRGGSGKARHQCSKMSITTTRFA
jgi:hypothetical protein